MRNPAGIPDLLPGELLERRRLVGALQQLFAAWGYLPVQPAALEFAGASGPAGQVLLIDRSQVLALRSDYTQSVARIVATHYPQGPYPIRLQYDGKLWCESSDLTQRRESTQCGLELIGPSTALADAEVIRLAAEAAQVMGLKDFRLELGHPGLVRAVLEGAGLVGEELEQARGLVHRKDQVTLEKLVLSRGDRRVARAAAALPELFGGAEVLQEARHLALTAA
ncbi:MAG: ATP phosphoribosyltransferase regulatory subunit, partial [Deinococcus sp.]|nr:ATP phosphoribosyltransferase regulatory subunit [Deinococcus sp.]